MYGGQSISANRETMHPAPVSSLSLCLNQSFVGKKFIKMQHVMSLFETQLQRF